MIPSPHDAPDLYDDQDCRPLRKSSVTFRPAWMGDKKPPASEGEGPKDPGPGDKG